MKENVFQLFARQASPLQRTAIEIWLRKPGNEEQYYEWLEEWERQHALCEDNSEKAFVVFRDFMEQHEPNQPPVVVERPVALAFLSFPLRTLLAAACAVLILGIGFWWRSEWGQYRVYQTAYGEKKTVTLADGSRVSLMGNAALKVPRWGFTDRQREVWLRGRANFEVVHTRMHTSFIVHTSHNWKVHVLGTVFSVRASPRLAMVRLHSGKVKLVDRVGNVEQSLILNPNDVARLDAHHRWVVRSQKTKWAEWKENRFDFNALTLRQVGDELEEEYGIRVQIPDQALAARVLMGSFNARSVDELLQSIALLLNVRVERRGNTVVFQP
ncbi:FecR family protein [Spirosoma montaniterrae]|uniref:Uncharacterized protein n=1 Tax=Spirosoma montaniterrae TaxID=1178516 RepID=A0A1P9WS83_9BACT|nr:FecR domain-containing protein [Spirosoma montaniterrae]AQG78227.1 hypothetical protein AWR27_02010 [Spirosoma montaniterrae]